MPRTHARARTFILAPLAVAILALTATPSSAELTPWDQEKVTALAGDLHKKTQELRASVRREVPPTTGSPSKTT